MRQTKQLWNKMEVNGLLESYLKNRKQYVSINGFHSITMPIKCGVPQGSSLGRDIYK